MARWEREGKGGKDCILVPQERTLPRLFDEPAQCSTALSHNTHQLGAAGFSTHKNISDQMLSPDLPFMGQGIPKAYMLKLRLGYQNPS